MTSFNKTIQFSYLSTRTNYAKCITTVLSTITFLKWLIMFFHWANLQNSSFEKYIFVSWQLQINKFT